MKYDYDREKYKVTDDDFIYIGKRTNNIEKIDVINSDFKKIYLKIKKNRFLYFLIIIFVLIMIISIFAPYISKYSYYEQINDRKYLSILEGFKNNYYLGTDSLGRDFFVRLSQGIKISIFISIIVLIISSIIGIIYGSFLGYKEGLYDLIFFRIIEIIISIPTMIYVVLFVLIFGNSVETIILSMIFTRWIYYAMIARAEVLRLKKNNYVIASKSLGGNFFWILRKHFLPNYINIIIVKISSDIPSVIFNEAFLSFIGLGIPFPKASLGNLLYDGFKEMNNNILLFIFPLIVLIVISLTFNLLSDFLSDNLNK